MNPGSAVLPAKSTQRVILPHKRRTSRLVPSATIRPPLIARASRCVFSASVKMLPLYKIKSAATLGSADLWMCNDVLKGRLNFGAERRSPTKPISEVDDAESYSSRDITTRRRRGRCGSYRRLD